MKRYILLASLLSVGILGLVQSAGAANAAPPTGVKVEKKASVIKSQATTVIIRKDESGKAIGYQIYGDPSALETVTDETMGGVLQESGCDGPCCVWESGSCTKCCDSEGNC